MKARPLPIIGINLLVMLGIALHGYPARAADPWQALQKQYERRNQQGQTTSPEQKAADPWARLRAIYLPFTEAEEDSALTDEDTGRRVAAHLNRAVKPYEELINEAAGRFNIPPEIIAGVIMVESAGNPTAKAATSTASGLMQTISSTFAGARTDLTRQGVIINSSPFDPHASVMAGSWYLDRMFIRAANDRPGQARDRNALSSWRYPLQYYYAGPGNGKKRNDIVIIYSGGRRILIDKPAYSAKVLKWANIMRARG